MDTRNRLCIQNRLDIRNRQDVQNRLDIHDQLDIHNRQATKDIPKSSQTTIQINKTFRGLIWRSKYPERSPLRCVRKHHLKGILSFSLMRAPCVRQQKNILGCSFSNASLTRALTCDSVDHRRLAAPHPYLRWGRCDCYWSFCWWSGCPGCCCCRRTTTTSWASAAPTTWPRSAPSARSAQGCSAGPGGTCAASSGSWPGRWGTRRWRGVVRGGAAPGGAAPGGATASWSGRTATTPSRRPPAQQTR